MIMQKKRIRILIPIVSVTCLIVVVVLFAWLLRTSYTYSIEGQIEDVRFPNAHSTVIYFADGRVLLIQGYTLDNLVIGHYYSFEFGVNRLGASYFINHAQIYK